MLCHCVLIGYKRLKLGFCVVVVVVAADVVVVVDDDDVVVVFAEAVAVVENKIKHEEKNMLPGIRTYDRWISVEAFVR